MCRRAARRAMPVCDGRCCSSDTVLFSDCNPDKHVLNSRSLSDPTIARWDVRSLPVKISRAERTAVLLKDVLSLFVRLTRYALLNHIDLSYLPMPTMEPQTRPLPPTRIPDFHPRSFLRSPASDVTHTPTQTTLTCSPVAGVPEAAAHRCHPPSSSSVPMVQPTRCTCSERIPDAYTNGLPDSPDYPEEQLYALAKDFGGVVCTDVRPPLVPRTCRSIRASHIHQPDSTRLRVPKSAF
jgi:hypothetical protein